MDTGGSGDGVVSENAVRCDPQRNIGDCWEGDYQRKGKESPANRTCPENTKHESDNAYTAS